MIDHPLMVLLFVMANLASAAAFLFIGLNVFPRSVFLSRRTRALGVGAACASALAHAVLAMIVLFRPDTSAATMTASAPALVLHAAVALLLWVFIVAAYVERGGTGPFTPPRESQSPAVVEQTGLDTEGERL